MLRKSTLISVFIAVAILTVPATALANKQLYKARLSSANELHEVVDPGAAGSFVLGARPWGYDFQLSIHSPSGPATGIHLHGPATEAENAGVVVTLCGAGPGTPILATCPAAEDGFIRFSGSIPGTAITGITPPEFIAALNGNLIYVNAHTTLNPAGETRGQLIRQ